MEDDQWDDYTDDEPLKTKCLFSDRIFSSPKECWQQAKTQYSFDMSKLKKEWHLTIYDHIKLINYIRTCVQSPSVDRVQLVSCLSKDKDAPWRDNQYLLPVLDDDPLLSNVCFGEGEEEGSWSDDDGILAPEFGNRVDQSNLSKEELLVQLERAQNSLLEAQMAIAQKESIISRLQSITQNYLLGDVKSDNKGEVQTQPPDPTLTTNPKEDVVAEDNNYFSSYAHYGIHYSMLSDTVRTEGYRSFIFKNSDLFKGKVVLDLGCGTGILSFFAAQAGASQVIAVDNSDIIDTAMENAKENGIMNISFIKQKVELIEDFGKNILAHVDIIISEWMGYCLLLECMLPSVLIARDRWCGNSGLVYPDLASMLISGWCDEEYYQKKIGYWSDVYGFKMTTIKEKVWKEPQVETIEKKAVITDVCTFKVFDINTVKIGDLDFSAPFTLTVQQQQQLHGFVVYFDIQFLKNCQQPVSFSTGPFTPDTHWHQTIFILEHPVMVDPTDKIVGTISFKRNQHHRNLKITIGYSLLGKTKTVVYQYTL